MTGKVYSVEQINRYIRGMFSRDGILASCSVSGEVTNLKYHSSGHIYFSLKDRSGTLSCIMFAGNRRGLPFQMKDGDKVIVSGTVDVFERDGRYQLYAKKIELSGEGALYAQFLALKKELEECGYFDPAFKRPVPRYAARVGIVTAPTGAAIRDIQNIASRRNPFVSLILAPVQVQGTGAKESIVNGIRLLDGRVDVIIVGRGGGSYEDLWAFNERIVADAINECGTPVISAVGHETDFTIADFVADLRAPTPSAAAELAVFDYMQFRADLTRYESLFTGKMLERCRMAEEKLQWNEVRLKALSPQMKAEAALRKAREYEACMDAAMKNRIEAGKETVSGLSERFYSAAAARAAAGRELHGSREARMREGILSVYRRYDRKLALMIEKFRGMNPLDRLRQGYSYTADMDGRAVTSVSRVQAGDRLNTYVTDGIILTEVLERSMINGS